jgi:hypothetical protein
MRAHESTAIRHRYPYSAFATSRASPLCDKLFPAGIEAYRKGSAVVAIGVRRRGVGSDNSPRRPAVVQCREG